MRINDDPNNDKCPFNNVTVGSCHAWNDGVCMNGFICDPEDIPPIELKENIK